MHLTARARLAELAGWSAAALVALSAHVGTAAWLMREEPVMPAEDQPPAAIMIEFATEAEAVHTEETEITPDQQTAEAAQPVEEVETRQEETPPEEPVEEEAQAEPVEDVAEEPLPEEIVEEVENPIEQELALLPDAEVPLPVARPKPSKEKMPEEAEPVRRQVLKKQPPMRAKDKPPKPRQTPQAASKSAVQAQAQVRRSSRNAGRQTASGLFSSQSPARWQSRLMAHLERRKKYPADARARGERGIVYVRFTIDDSGNVRSVSLARSSGYPSLDNEVLSLVRRASPVPAPPPGANKTITAPVRFSNR